jgi:hypothetical protein
MSSHELNRVEVMGRVKNGDLKLSDAAEMSPFQLLCSRWNAH